MSDCCSCIPLIITNAGTHIPGNVPFGVLQVFPSSLVHCSPDDFRFKISVSFFDSKLLILFKHSLFNSSDVQRFRSDEGSV